MRYSKILLISLIILGSATWASGYSSGQENKDALLIYGQDFMFRVTEPEGWRGHTEDAYRYRMNAYFCPGEKDINNSPAIMHISVLDKGDENIQQHLAYDMQQYQKHYRNIKFQDFPIEGLNYRYASRIFIIEDKTIDYVCFLDPGEKSQLYVVFVLHGPREESPKYEQDFIRLIKSFRWLS